MKPESHSFVLQSRDASAAAPVLSGITARGCLDGVLFSLVLRQTYRNLGDVPLEVVYTFPLPARAVLLGFASELNGERKQGRIVAAAIAERRYEAALSQGDAPVMLESLRGGLYTANIGNLAPGDEIVLEVRIAELLRFDQNRLRLAIPTTIAPRYGNPVRSGLQPQQVPTASLLADYPLELTIDLGATLRGATVECPTHAFRCAPKPEEEGEGLRFALAQGARLDRDVVVIATLREPRPGLLVQATDPHSAESPRVLMAALQPRPKDGRNPIALKIAVDCSGSMAGDAITSAKAALRGVIAGMQPRDWLGLSRFGTTVQHALDVAPCTRRKLAQALALVDSIEADMGGTEMHGAMRSVFLQPMEGFRGRPDVLLITDGQIWEPQHLVPSAQVNGHRIFIVAVGAAAAEAGLRELADTTGGACEFVTPGEDLEAAARRMIDRMHRHQWHAPSIDWGGTPLWQTALPVVVAGGETVIAFAGMAPGHAVTSVRLLASDDDGLATEIARSEAAVPTAGDDLARVAASTRLSADTLAPDVAQALAIQHQLMTRATKCVLVHQRASADQTVAAANLHRVDTMLPAGWGGTSRSQVRLVASWRVPTDPSETFASCTDTGLAKPDISERIRQRRNARDEVFAASMAPDTGMDRPVLLDLAARITALLSAGTSVQDLAASCQGMVVEPAIREAVDLGLQQTTMNASEVWLVLVRWANEQWPDALRDARAEVLHAEMAQIDRSKTETLFALFDRLLGHLAPATGPSARSRRLAQATGASQA